MTHRGYREKWLHKSLQKNKDGICKTLDSDRVSKPSFINHLIQETAKLAQNDSKLRGQEAQEGVESQDEHMECEGSVTKPLKAVEKECNGGASEKKQEPSHSSIDWDPFFLQEAAEIARRLLEYLEGMETRLFDAHLQIKASQISVPWLTSFRTQFFLVIQGHKRRESTPIPEQLEQCDASHAQMVSLVAEKLLKFESMVERRYLKPPFRIVRYVSCSYK